MLYLLLDPAYLVVFVLYEYKFRLCSSDPGDIKQKKWAEEKGGQINNVAAVSQAITSPSIHNVI